MWEDGRILCVSEVQTRSKIGVQAGVERDKKGGHRDSARLQRSV